MGLLEKLWDDTVAGPRPDYGLGRLRKSDTFNFRSTSGKDLEGAGNGNGRSYGEESLAADQEAVRVTRSIMIMKPPGYSSGGSAPASPAGSTPPASPFSGSRSGAFKFRRRSTSDAYGKTTNEDGARSPPSPQDV